MVEVKALQCIKVKKVVVFKSCKYFYDTRKTIRYINVNFQIRVKLFKNEKKSFCKTDVLVLVSKLFIRYFILAITI